MTHDPVDYHQLLVDHLDLVDRVVRFVARRHHLPAHDAEEFSSIVRVKLIDRDYAVLRKFQGRSNIGTYLTTVVERMYLDFRIARWGKWRPSATARRLGPVAMTLEQLITRDGLSFDEAVGTLHTNYGVGETRHELHGLFVQLPVRAVRPQGRTEDLALVRERGVTDTRFDDRDHSELADRVESALLRAVDRLSAQDQLTLQLRYLDNLSVASIARLLQTDSKRLYRQLASVFQLIREALKRDGIERSDIERVVGHPAVTFGRVLQRDLQVSPENQPARPSNA